MSDEEPFLQAVLAAPDDDGPRLRYADFLEEGGDLEGVARAEFVRVQIALERLPEDDPSWADLIRREQTLLREYRGRWLRPVYDLFRSEGWSVANWLANALEQVSWCFALRRGFPEEVGMPYASFRTAGPRIASVAPIRHMLLSGRPADLPRLFGQLQLEGKVRLHYRCSPPSRRGVIDFGPEGLRQELLEALRDAGVIVRRFRLPCPPDDVLAILGVLVGESERANLAAVEEGLYGPRLAGIETWRNSPAEERERIWAYARRPRQRRLLHAAPGSSCQPAWESAFERYFFGGLLAESGAWAVVRAAAHGYSRNCRDLYALFKPDLPRGPAFAALRDSPFYLDDPS